MSGTFTGDAPLSCRRIRVTFLALLAQAGHYLIKLKKNEITEY